MTLADTMAAKPPPLVIDSAGIVRVSGSRVTLQTIVEAYGAGQSVEAIALSYDSVSLATVHGIVSYYLEHRAEVDEYLAEQRQRSETARTAHPPREPWGDLRQRLRNRQGHSGC